MKTPIYGAVKCGHGALRFSALVVLGLLSLMSAPASASNIVLSDSGSTATINPGDGTGNLGMNEWSVMGLDQLNQQWFWFSIGGGVATPLNTFGSLTVTPLGLDSVTLSYDNGNGVTANIQYTLAGNGVGSGSADITESIWLDNHSGSTLTDLRLYQYSDFNLLPNNPNNVTITGSELTGFTGASQTVNGGGGSGIAELVFAPLADHAEAGFAGATLFNIENIAGYTLNGNTSEGPGDVAWAFEWDADVLNNDVFYIFKDKGLSITAVPEPSGMGLIALGLGALGLVRRRRG